MKARTALVVGTAVATLLAGAVPALAEDRKRPAKKTATVIAPANDAFAMGTEVAELPFETTIDLRGASVEKSEPLPSCSEAVATVWYRFTPAQDMDVVGTAASAAPVGVAIHSGTDLSTLSEVACAPAAPDAHIALPATAGTTYFVQVSAPKPRKAPVEFSLKVDNWKQVDLLERELEVVVPAIDQAAVVIDGKPREGKRGIYDLTIQAGSQTVGPFGIETNPAELPAIHQELVKVEGQTVDVTLTSWYRYDSAQGRCVLYQGEECLQMVPVSSDASWYTGGEGSEAELVVSLKVTKNNNVLAERVVAAPFAGQLAGLLP